MAQIIRTFDITLTEEFTNYLQDLINKDWNEQNVIWPQMVIKQTITNPVLGTTSTLKVLGFDGFDFSGYSLPDATSTTISLPATEDPQEIDPPTLTGHLLLTGTYATEPTAKTITFEILAVRDEDFTPEVG